jgi:hypothetical protein
MAMDLVKIITENINKEQTCFDGKPLYVHEIQLLNNNQHNKTYRDKQSSLSVSNEMLLYHGAPENNINKIILDNFDINEACNGMGGHIGKGIYFSDMAEQSIYYCLKGDGLSNELNYLGTETDFIILVCKVELGRCCQLVRCAETFNCAKLNSYDSHTTPYRQGNKVGNEYCLFDSEQIVPVCKLHLKVK